jgi:molecular chaperone DnaK
MPHDKPIGIDLGTTNSAMAWVDGAGRSAMVANAEGELITPSVVYFSESEVVVGKNARTAITAHPDMVAQWVKRDMGAAFYSHPIHGHYLPPEVIQACILRKLKADLIRELGPDVPAVITVPAYFDEMRRKATADAGEMAGLRVLDIVNEPTAAAIAFGEALGYLNEVSPQPQVRRPSGLTEDEALGYLTDGPRPGNRSSPHPSPLPEGEGTRRQELNVLVYDLGGGTFDVTVLRLAAGKVQTLATDGDVQLGGHDWDQRLVNRAAETFIEIHGLDPRKDPATLNRLFLDAMEAKHTLTARNRVVIQVNYEGHSAEIAVAREQFEEMSADLLERTAYTSRQVLSAAGLEWKDLQRVLLVGGSTRMPMVARMLQSLTGIQPDRTVNPDEAVARGAALYASHLLAGRTGGAASTFDVTNVNSHSLGIEGIETDTLRKKNIVLIPRNTALPARHTERFATKSDGQRSIVIKVLEGESSQPGECIAIGRTVVRDLPAGLPKGWPVEVTFEYGTNGRLAVEALVPGTDHRGRLELVRDTGLSSEGLARWKRPVESAGGINAFESAIDDALQVAAPGDPSPSGIGAATGWTSATDAGAAGASLVEARAGVPPGHHACMVGGLSGTPAKAGTTGANWSFTPQALGSPLAAESPATKPDEPAAPAARREKLRRERRIPLWAERLIGHIIVMVLFGIFGYLMLSRIRPDLFPGFFGRGQPQNEQRQTDASS